MDSRFGIAGVDYFTQKVGAKHSEGILVSLIASDNASPLRSTAHSSRGVSS
jgi:hypothetical protein